MPSFNAQTRASVFDDNFRPSVEKVYERLGDFFPEHNLDEPVIEASPGGTSLMSAEASQSPPTQDRRKRRKSVRVVTRKIWEPERAFQRKQSEPFGLTVMCQRSSNGFEESSSIMAGMTSCTWR